MTFSFKNIFDKNDSIENKTTANVVDNHLILSLPKALDPVVWRMELKKTGAAAFEVKEDKNGLSLLQVKLTKTSAETIAPFDNKSDAVEALMIASQALQNSSQSTETLSGTKGKSSQTKKAKSSNTTASANDNQSVSKWLIALLATGIIIALFSYLSNMVPNRTQISDTTTSSSINGAPVTSKTGVPVSADDFLNGL